MFWIVISPSSFSFSREKVRIRGQSSIRRTEPAKPGRRSSRPMNMLSVIDRAGDMASD